MKKLIKIKKNRGMSYVELIVVLSVFSVMTSVIIFNYREFQAKIDIKNLASDVALKIIEAQNSSLSGTLPPPLQQSLITSPLTWRPSYGLFLNRVSDDKSFIYFTDLDQNGDLDNLSCTGNDECLDKILITKGNSISSLDVFYQGGATVPLNDLTITFKRPDSGAIIKSSTSFTSTVSYVQITIISPKSPTAKIKIYPSGRIQVN